MSLVDLAGSERSKRTNNTGERRNEAGAINASLALLKDCLKYVGGCATVSTLFIPSPKQMRSQPFPFNGHCNRALHKNQAKGKHSDIPRFNQSKLTKLFQNYLCGNGMAAMMVRLDGGRQLIQALSLVRFPPQCGTC
jgi:hypothetical protein